MVGPQSDLPFGGGLGPGSTGHPSRSGSGDERGDDLLADWRSVGEADEDGVTLSGAFGLGARRLAGTTVSQYVLQVPADTLVDVLGDAVRRTCARSDVMQWAQLPPGVDRNDPFTWVRPDYTPPNFHIRPIFGEPTLFP